ncbi:MAG TPA: alpha/beta fold hydrolase [Thermoanaerobaculia bacterium]|jgi:pimeloyl-ACP methyl ester carboxylesterase|nr:alpha/beta fold hydrolase [Thermoanaerobaculia bacterium]
MLNLPVLPRVLSLTLLLGMAVAQAAHSAENATGMIEVPNSKLWYEVRGEGPAVVLLHDGLLPSASWGGPFDELARSFRVVRYDRRGFGRSEAGKEPFSDVDDLQAVFEALKIGRAALVGCSNGSKLAVDYTLAHPDRVGALFLVGPVISGLPYSEHFQRRGLANFRPYFREKSVEKLIDAWVHDPYLVDSGDTAGKEHLRAFLRTNPGPVTGAVPQSRPPERPALGRLGEIHVPVRIVVGASDIPDVQAHAGILEAGIHGARREVWPGVGHFVQLEKPEQLAREIHIFLRPDEVAKADLIRVSQMIDPEANRRLFDYDAGAPLEIQEAGTEKRGDVQVVDLSYASPLGGRVPAYLVLPPGPPGAVKHPAVLFLHPGQGSRTTFVDEAVELARDHGFVALTISAPFLRPENRGKRGGNPWNPEVSRKEQVQTIVDVRRGFDLLAARPEVDPKRLAYVGHSLGATVGGTLAGIEKRPIAYVLMAGYSSLTKATSTGHDQSALAFQEFLTPEQQKAYVDALAPLDAVHYLGQSRPAKLLFQFAKNDDFVTPLDAAISLAAAPDPKDVKWYDTDHYFNAEARRDRGEWLERTMRP